LAEAPSAIVAILLSDKTALDAVVDAEYDATTSRVADRTISRRDVRATGMARRAALAAIAGAAAPAIVTAEGAWTGHTRPGAAARTCETDRSG
jgi:hypothetical protein